MLKVAPPKTAQGKRALAKQEPLIIENPKTTLFLKGSKCSEILQLAMRDINALKQPHTIKFTRKNDLNPFTDSSSFSFFSAKNDASLLLFGRHSKKRPHSLTLIRCFDHAPLDMAELYVVPHTFRSISQFKTPKVPVGLKPLVAFSGSGWAPAVPDRFSLLKSLLLDLFAGGPHVEAVDVEGLQYCIHFSVGSEGEAEREGEAQEGSVGIAGDAVEPLIRMRVYKLSTHKSGQKIPRVELVELGPRIDFRVGRVQEADEAKWKESLKKPKVTQEKTKKNIEIDIMGDKIGRIHVGRQDLDSLQTRKMKGLKRGIDDIQDDNMDVISSGKIPKLTEPMEL